MKSTGLKGTKIQMLSWILQVLIQMQVAIPNHHNHEAQDLLEWTAHQPLGKGLNFPRDIRTYCVVETVK